MRFLTTILCLLASLSVLPLPSIAAELDYQVEESESTLTSLIGARMVVTILETPVTLADEENLVVALSGNATVDTGLPEDFDNGSNGLFVSSLRFGAEAPEGESLVTLSDTQFVFNPLSQSQEPVTVIAQVRSMTVIANGPFASPLTATAMTDEYSWGPVDVSLTVAMDASVTVTVPPSLPPFPLWDGPIADNNYVVPAQGTFAGDATGTWLTLSVAVGDLVFDELIEPGGFYTFDTHLEAGNIQANVVATNPTPLPEPLSTMLAGVSVVVVTLLGAARRRSRSA